MLVAVVLLGLLASHSADASGAAIASTCRLENRRCDEEQRDTTLPYPWIPLLPALLIHESATQLAWLQMKASSTLLFKSIDHLTAAACLGTAARGSKDFCCCHLPAW